MQPKIVEKRPVVFEIEAGEYSWCACGLSTNQPYCDGSHKGTGLSPLRFQIEEKRRVALCNCKYTKEPPFCDGIHSGL